MVLDLIRLWVLVKRCYETTKPGKIEWKDFFDVKNYFLVLILLLVPIWIFGIEGVMHDSG